MMVNAETPKLVLVGLPDSAVRESVDRVQSSLSSSGFTLPRTHTTINLAPGDLRKEGASFDLPIALSLLASTKQMNGDILKEFLVAGELGLSGENKEDSWWYLHRDARQENEPSRRFAASAFSKRGGSR